jgi:hypothetical protein
MVTGLSGVVAVAAGTFHSVALKQNGTVWAWGSNTYGQLGDGSGADSLTPVVVAGTDGVISVAAGQYHTLALKPDGTVWAWGNNQFGQLGDGTTTNHPMPVMTLGLSGANRIAAGAFHSLAVKDDYTVWTWGDNECGQLGDGTTTNRTTAVQVPGLGEAVFVAGGRDHSLAVSLTPAARIEVQRQRALRGSSVHLAASLMVLSEGQRDRQLNFYLNGAFVGSAVTDANGAASVLANIPSDAKLGFYPVSVSYAGASDLLPCEGAGWLEVITARQQTSVYVPARSGFVGQTIPLTGLLRRKSDNGWLSGQIVTFEVEGTAIGSAVTNGSGRADLSWVVTPGSMSRTISAAFFGDEDYLPSSGSATLTTNPPTPYIWVAERTVNLGSMASLYAYFRTLPNRTPQPGKTVTFKIDGTVVTSMATDGSGVARYPYDTHGMTIAVHTIRCEYAGDAQIAPGYGEAPLTIIGVKPYIWVADRTVNVGRTASLYAYFRTLPDRTPQPGKTVTFKIDGTVVTSMATDSTGVARYPYDTHGMSQGSHTIRCEYGGDAEVAPGYGEAPLTILGAQPYIWVASRSAHPGAMTELYAYFRTWPDYTEQPGKSVTFKIDGTPVGTLVTDAHGVARHLYDTTGLSLGDHTVRCQFLGDATVAAGYGDGVLTLN